MFIDENLAHINEEFCGHPIFSGLKMKFVNMERALKLIWPENADDRRILSNVRRILITKVTECSYCSEMLCT